MQISKIQSTQYQQQNPNFGKLIIESNVPIDLGEAIMKNKNISKLVSNFDNIGRNLEFSYRGAGKRKLVDLGNFKMQNESLYMFERNKNNYFDSSCLDFFLGTKIIDEANNKSAVIDSILEQIKNINKSRAKKYFTEFLEKDAIKDKPWS